MHMKWILLTAAVLLSFGAQAAPKAELWARWQAQDATSKTLVDHREWDALLLSYLKVAEAGVNRFAYGKVSAADKTRLAHYLEQLQSTPVSKLARAEQRAYWINLYNAATVQTLLDHYPVESILKINISPGFFAKGPWGKKQLKVEGEDLSLDDIEHRILRPLWKDPRTHYAVNCASIGCPNLAPRAYTAANLEEQLDAGTRAYVNHARGARVENGKLHVSSIYLWFQDDFGGNDAGVIAHLRQYAVSPLSGQLAGISRISGDSYDWSLNNAP